LGSDIFLHDYIDDSDESDGIESAEDNDEEDTFMRPYSDAMNEELKATTLQKSFVRADEQIPKKDEVFCLGFWLFALVKNALNVSNIYGCINVT
jgi:hypothetical protein